MYNTSFLQLHGNSRATILCLLNGLGRKYTSGKSQTHIGLSAIGVGAKISSGYSNAIAILVNAQVAGVKQARAPPTIVKTLINTDGYGAKTAQNYSVTQIKDTAQSAGSVIFQGSNLAHIDIQSQSRGQKLITASYTATVRISSMGLGLIYVQGASETCSTVSVENNGAKVGLSDTTINDTSIFNSAVFGKIPYNGGKIIPHEARVYIIPEYLQRKTTHGFSETQTRVDTQSEGLAVFQDGNTSYVDTRIQGVGQKSTFSSGMAMVHISSEGLGFIYLLQGASETCSVVSVESNVNKIALSDIASDSPSVFNSAMFGQMPYNGGEIRPCEARVYIIPEYLQDKTIQGQSETKASIITQGRGTGILADGIATSGAIVAVQGIGKKTGIGENTAVAIISVEGAGFTGIEKMSSATASVITEATGCKIIKYSNTATINIIAQSPIAPLFCTVDIIGTATSLSLQTQKAIQYIIEQIVSLDVQINEPELFMQTRKAALSIQDSNVVLSAQEQKVLLEVEILSLINNTVRLKAEFRDFDGKIAVPDNVKLKIYDGTREQMGEDISILPDAQGKYWHDFVIPDNVVGQIYFEFIGTLSGNPILGRSIIDIRWV